MSPEREDLPPVDESQPVDEAVPTTVALRGGWSGWSAWSPEIQAKIDANECTDARCMNVEVNCGYQGLVEDSVLSQSAGVGDDLRSAWKQKLQGEGKKAGGKSLRETIFGGSERVQ